LSFHFLRRQKSSFTITNRIFSNSNELEMIQFFFFLISQNIIRKRRGAQPIIHRTYTRKSLRGKREVRKEIQETNYKRDKPIGCLGVKRKKKIMKNFLKRPRRVFKVSYTTFPSNTPHKTNESSSKPLHSSCNPPSTSKQTIP
jgi:hypothetical protein